jgi:hypothetical protein
VVFGSRKGIGRAWRRRSEDGDVFHDSGERCEFRCEIAILITVVSRLMSGVERLWALDLYCLQKTAQFVA